MKTNGRSILKYSVMTSVVLVLAFTTAQLVHFPGFGTAQATGTKVRLVTSSSAMSSERVPSAGISLAGNGWVLTTAGLELTANGGASFYVVHSPIPTLNIHDVAIRGKHVLVAGVINGSPVIELSEDSGATWKVVPLASGSGNAGVAQFVKKNGIIVGLLVTDVTSSNFSSGEWYATSDGGVTWTHHEMPAAGLVTAVGGDLWLSAGPLFTSLYRSDNQGVTWTRVLIPAAASANGNGLSVPGQFNNGDIVLVTTAMNLDGEHKFGVRVYVSGDRGATWKILTHTSFAGHISSGELVISAVFNNTLWLGSPTDHEVVTILPNGKVALASTTNEIYPGGAINSISPTGNSSAWVTTTKGICLSGKTSCTEVGVLIKTTDKGKTWFVANLEPSALLG